MTLAKYDWKSAGKLAEISLGTGGAAFPDEGLAVTVPPDLPIVVVGINGELRGYDGELREVWRINADPAGAAVHALSAGSGFFPSLLAGLSSGAGPDTALRISRFDLRDPAPRTRRVVAAPNVLDLTVEGISTAILVTAESPAGVTVSVLDITGRKIRDLSVTGGRPTVEARWDGKDATGGRVPPGTYFIRASGGDADGFAPVAVVR